MSRKLKPAVQHDGSGNPSFRLTRQKPSPPHKPYHPKKTS